MIIILYLLFVDCLSPLIDATIIIDDMAEPRFYSGAQKTPYMGYNTYYTFGSNYTRHDLLQVAQFISDSGLLNAGYDLFWIDVGWADYSNVRVENHYMADPVKFPMDNPPEHPLETFVRMLKNINPKFRAGIYTDCSPKFNTDCSKNCSKSTCFGSGPTLCRPQGYYDIDAADFLKWGFSAVKAGWRSGYPMRWDPRIYALKFAKEVTSKGLIFNFANSITQNISPYTLDFNSLDYYLNPMNPASTYALIESNQIAYAYAPYNFDSWRIDNYIPGTDPDTTVYNYCDIIERLIIKSTWHISVTGPGHYQDLDCILPMRPAPDGSYKLTFEESQTQISFLAMVSAPMIIGSDPRKFDTIDPTGRILKTLTNPDMISISQDPLVRSAVCTIKCSFNLTMCYNNSYDFITIFVKPLSLNGSRAVLLWNRFKYASARTEILFSSLSLGNAVASSLIKDVYANITYQPDKGASSWIYYPSIPGHGSALLIFSGWDSTYISDIIAGDQPVTSSPAIFRVNNTEVSVFARDNTGLIVRSSLVSATQFGPWITVGNGKKSKGSPSVIHYWDDVYGVFIRAFDDDQIWYTSKSVSTWYRLNVFPGGFTSPPSVAIGLSSECSTHVFARGKDGALYWRDPFTNNTDWTSLGTPRVFSDPTYYPGNNPNMFGTPTSVYFEKLKQILVAVKGVDEYLYYRKYDCNKKYTNIAAWEEWKTFRIGWLSSSPSFGLSKVNNEIQPVLIATLSSFTFVFMKVNSTTGDLDGTWNWPDSIAVKNIGSPSDFTGTFGVSQSKDGILWSASVDLDGKVRVNPMFL